MGIILEKGCFRIFLICIKKHIDWFIQLKDNNLKVEKLRGLVRPILIHVKCAKKNKKNTFAKIQRPLGTLERMGDGRSLLFTFNLIL